MSRPADRPPRTGGSVEGARPFIPILPSPSSSGAVPGAQGAAPQATPGSLQALPPLSLYIHLPWCLRKCPYCDFNSHERRPSLAEQAQYRQALLADLESSLAGVWGRPVHSVFIGGGTPSLFEPEEIDRLLGEVRARLKLEPGCEITLEANPGTFERDRFAAYAQAGITRLSIGVQSFNDEALQAIGRVHDGAQARAAVEEAARVFDTWNIDLMYALPGQDAAALERDLKTALDFNPPHLSIYHLTMEPNTRFATQPPPGLPDEETAFEMLDLIVAATDKAGLSRYEVSAFSRPGHRCTHNLNYWRFGDYLGIGAGAHGKISFPDRIVRQTRWRDPATYLREVAAGRPVSNEQAIESADRPFEFMLNGLRLLEGVNLRTFTERTGLPMTVLQPTLDRALARELIAVEGLQLRPTARGLDFLSDLQAMFLPD